MTNDAARVPECIPVCFEDETLHFHTQQFPLIAMHLAKTEETIRFTLLTPCFLYFVTLYWCIRQSTITSQRISILSNTSYVELDKRICHAYRSAAIPLRNSNKSITFQRQNLPTSLLAYRIEEQLVPLLQAAMQVVVASKHQLKPNSGHKTNKLPTPTVLNFYHCIMLVGKAQRLFYSNEESCTQQSRQELRNNQTQNGMNFWMVVLLQESYTQQTGQELCNNQTHAGRKSSTIVLLHRRIVHSSSTIVLLQRRIVHSTKPSRATQQSDTERYEFLDGCFTPNKNRALNTEHQEAKEACQT
jgi:hypothetical protein